MRTLPMMRNIIVAHDLLRATSHPAIPLSSDQTRSNLTKARNSLTNLQTDAARAIEQVDKRIAYVDDGIPPPTLHAVPDDV